LKAAIASSVLKALLGSAIRLSTHPAKEKSEWTTGASFSEAGAGVAAALAVAAKAKVAKITIDFIVKKVITLKTGKKDKVGQLRNALEKRSTVRHLYKSKMAPNRPVARYQDASLFQPPPQH
jgi:hypothetical protein